MFNPGGFLLLNKRFASASNREAVKEAELVLLEVSSCSFSHQAYFHL